MSEINLERLALHVIKTAIVDAIKDETKTKHELRRIEVKADKKEALEFLTIPNADLEFWANAANLNYDLVFKETQKLISDPKYWKTVLKKLKLLEK